MRKKLLIAGLIGLSVMSLSACSRGDNQSDESTTMPIPLEQAAPTTTQDQSTAASTDNMSDSATQPATDASSNNGASTDGAASATTGDSSNGAASQ